MLRPEDLQRERTTLLSTSPPTPRSSQFSCEDSVVLMLQSAKENGFNQQGLYALKKLEHKSLILLAKVYRG